MALNGEGEPQPTLMQAATQAVTIELFAQWQTYANGVHMDWDTFRSIDFRALAVAAITGSGFSVKALDVAVQLPPLDDDLNITTGPPVTLPAHRTLQGVRERHVTLAGTTLPRDVEATS